MLLTLITATACGLGVGETVGAALVAVAGISEAAAGAITLTGGAVGLGAGIAECCGGEE